MHFKWFLAAYSQIVCVPSLPYFGEAVGQRLGFAQLPVVEDRLGLPLWRLLPGLRDSALKPGRHCAAPAATGTGSPSLLRLRTVTRVSFPHHLLLGLAPGSGSRLRWLSLNTVISTEWHIESVSRDAWLLLIPAQLSGLAEFCPATDACSLRNCSNSPSTNLLILWFRALYLYKC